MAGIRDIAEKCGVSEAAVSRILNCDPSLSVTMAVRRSVEAEAARIGYKTPRQRKAQPLRVSLVLAPVDKPGFEERLLEYLRPIAAEAGIALSLSAGGKCTDALIALGEFTAEEISYFKNIAKELLFINNLGLEYSYDSIMIDYSNAEKQVLDYFLSKGIRNIGYVGGVFHRTASIIGVRRMEEFRRLLSDNSLFNEKWFSIGQMNSESGYRIVMDMATLPDGIFISDPDTAEGVFRALEERCAVVETVTYNNFFPSAVSHGTELRIFTLDVWRTAFRLLTEKVKGEREQSFRVFCPACLY